MEIAILDDEKSVCNELKNLLFAYAKEKKQMLDCTCFTSAADLLSSRKFDIYFLDYWMPEMNGVDVAQQLRTRFDGCVTVCFLTSYEKAAVDVINRNISASAFLMKPVNREHLRETLDKLFDSSLLNRIVLKKEHTTRIFHAQDILYAEAMKRKCIFHFRNGTEEFPYYISELKNGILPSTLFYKTHRSYIVNLQYVKSYDGHTVCLQNGEQIPLTDSAAFAKAYMDFNL